MFKIGQKIVAIKDHSQLQFLKGDEFIVRNIIPGRCKCHKHLVDIGINGTCEVGHCIECDVSYFKSKQEWYFSSSSFAPIVENTSTADIAQQIFSQHPELQEIKIPEYV